MESESSSSSSSSHVRRKRSEEAIVLGQLEDEDLVKASSPYFKERLPHPGADVPLSCWAPEQKALSGKQTSLPKDEQLSFWLSIVESAAASEVVVNLLLPCLMCSLREGIWQPPSEWSLLILALILNLGGTFAEGFFKSIRLLSQPMRWTQKDHWLVFVTSEGFSSGFLSVTTSFPGVSGSGSGIPLGLNSLVFGALYSLLNMIGSLLCYLWGCRVGRLCFRRQWVAILCFCKNWRMISGGLVLACLLLPLAASPAFAVSTGWGSGHAGNAREGGGSWLPALPLDLAEPELRPAVRLPSLEFRGIVIFKCPPFVLGLFFGILFSSAGALLATFFCGSLCQGRARPAARLLTNGVACSLAYMARAIDALIDMEEGKDAISITSDFLRSKFVGSFCGALSAFSGTIGDVADAYFGAAPEDSCLDKPKQEEVAPRDRRCSKLPQLPGVQNLLLHWAMTLVVMWGCARFETWPHPEQPAAMSLPAQPRAAGRFIRKSDVVPWGSMAPDVDEDEV